MLFRGVPMAADAIRSLQRRWDTKPVIDATLIDRGESLEHWELTTASGGPNLATVAVSTERRFQGAPTLKFTCPTKKPDMTGPVSILQAHGRTGP
jgi:hypothetical protein